MSFNLAIVSLLCFIPLMTSVRATHGPSRNCICLSPKEPRFSAVKVVDYYRLGEICSVPAVVFRTIEGKSFCALPGNKRTEDLIAKVDQRKNRESMKVMGDNEKQSTTTISPTVMSTTERFQTSSDSTMSPDLGSTTSQTTTAVTEVEQKTQGPASTITSTVSSTSKNALKWKLKNSKKRGRKTRRSGRQWMKKCV